MRQDYRVAVGADLLGACLPDGSAPAAIAIDNHSGYWYQLAPGGDWISPYTTGIVYTVDAIPDLRAMASGPAGQASATTGDPLLVTVFDAGDAPADSRGNTLSWLTPATQSLRFLGIVQPDNAVPPTTPHQFTILPTERSLYVLTPPGNALYTTQVVQGSGALPSMQMTDNAALPTTWMVAPVLPERSLTWNVYVGQTVPLVNNQAYVFASPAMPIVELAVGRGEALAKGSIPVVLASDSTLQIGNLFGLTGLGQQQMASSLPVAIASDQQGIRTYKQNGAATVFSNPASGTVASATMGPSGSSKIMLDTVTWFIGPGGLAAVNFSCDIRIIVSGSLQWSNSVSFTNSSAYNFDRITLGPGLGITSTAGGTIACDFNSNVANVFQRVAMVGYILPAGF